jgi:hypothetical protein
VFEAADRPPPQAQLVGTHPTLSTQFPCDRNLISELLRRSITYLQRRVEIVWVAVRPDTPKSIPGNIVAHNASKLAHPGHQCKGTSNQGDRRVRPLRHLSASDPGRVERERADGVQPPPAPRPPYTGGARPEPMAKFRVKAGTGQLFSEGSDCLRTPGELGAGSVPARCQALAGVRVTFRHFGYGAGPEIRNKSGRKAGGRDRD